MPDGTRLPSINTTCPYCGVGCGVSATPNGDNSAMVAGDIAHPSNGGRLCSKGSALGETLGLHGRLLAPRVDGKRANWDTAMARAAEGFRAAIEKHGPDSVAFYLSGQLLTEDYYVANKLMKGFIGSANVDTNSRLCMASAVAGHKRAFGADTVPGTYEDVEGCDLLILAGSNLAWCHPILYQRVATAKEKRPGMQIVVIDPRRTASCELADQHLPLKPGSDVALFQGLLTYLARHDCMDEPFIRARTNGVEDALEAAAPYDLTRVSQETGLPATELESFYARFAWTEKTVTLFSMGVNQARDGTDKVNAIINPHLLTGRIGKPGMGPFSMTGQPNAMGGREVGGLSNQLACHMDFDPASVDRVKRFWTAPNIAEKPGLKAVDLFEAVEDGRIKAIWIMATNPVVSMPDADRVKAALKACPLVIVSDIVDTDTTACADIVLPATGWGEKDGTVTNSERRISRQRAFLPPPGLARHDWQALSGLARRLGYGKWFAYGNPADIFREYAAMTAFENEGTRDLDLGGLSDLSDSAYDALAPIRWPVRKDGGQIERFFEDGQFFTEDRRANFVAPALSPKPAAKPLPLILNTGRIRDQWHTMTRTGRAARLNQHIGEPFAEIHAADAASIGITDAELLTLSNRKGRIAVRALITDEQQKGTVFVPMHWTGLKANAARVDSLVTPSPDPVSGQPALKSSRVKAAPLAPAWYGFAAGLSLTSPEIAYWARSTALSGNRMELAGSEMPDDWAGFARELFASQHDGELVEGVAGPGTYRAALFERGRLTGILIASSRPVAAARDWLTAQLGHIITGPERTAILAGFPGEGAADPGPIVCSCLGVGRNTLIDAIRDGATTLNMIGTCTGAGTNCGSCRPDIRKLMEARNENADA
ncbi:nitrate reductase [Henriciella aquimarina]|uniref:nitrate reductase n=1 Tax=Henriciella aquimarina TaxID=545261 RepID=UPI000A0656A8|nr:nitrate reductase [Henriciella aquimarina]